MGKRVLLFVATNIAIVLVLSVVLGLLGFSGILDEQQIGIDFGALLILAVVIGFGGSLISLALSKTMAKRMAGCRVIDTPRNEAERWLLDTVQRQARAAGIGMPEVAIYDAPEINAFATGARRNAALVAVSSGLLRGMTRDEAEAVLGHEVTHVANGDMVTLTLIQGVVNTFVVFLSHLVGHFIDRVLLRNESGHGPGFWIATLLAQVVLGVLASIIVMAFSRWREYGADRGGAELSSRRNMIAALQRLGQNRVASTLPDEVEAFGISGGVGQGLKRLFMSHPPIEERIAALKAADRNG
ncbi:protease HtpX [Halofilum ochraceum]|uniref:protease HtpX n=1 Tax=Halofilum ochraceum TaxID=1611323 RepID=UPI0008D9C98C|nr:protease HtpX [Halofilum ochraceum]